MIFVVQEEDPFKDARGYVDWNVRTEAHTVDCVAVEVFPDVHACTPESISIHALVKLGCDLLDLFMELVNLGLVVRVLLKVVLPPVEIEHQFGQENVNFNLTRKEAEKSRHDVAVTLVKSHRWV